jgi:hypothetical protein
MGLLQKSSKFLKQFQCIFLDEIYPLDLNFKPFVNKRHFTYFIEKMLFQA